MTPNQAMFCQHQDLIAFAAAQVKHLLARNGLFENTSFSFA
jgi:hypothetical protein